MLGQTVVAVEARAWSLPRCASHSAVCTTASMGATSVAKRRAPGGTDLPVVLGALTGGLLSSSCCVIQLLLNYLSVG